jgi:glutaredoxin
MNGARALGFNHIICVGDDTFCPQCKEKNGVVEKKGMSLDVLLGNNVICHWCYIKDWQDRDMHTPETCTHKKDDDVTHEEWRFEDCMAVLEAYEHSYKAILESEL